MTFFSRRINAGIDSTRVEMLSLPVNFNRSAAPSVVRWAVKRSYSGRIRKRLQTASTQLRLLFGYCSGAVRLGVEADSKRCRSPPEGASKMCPSCVEAKSKDSQTVAEQLPKRSDVKKFAFACSHEITKEPFGSFVTTR
ncbi:hypothetical protein [uncultured Sphingobacterium sp.]|uniref:hypothetical protein n=1 Tax=uncultured Sphingobacterium sp. TaxID=182688 RepID=UPI0025EE36B2|nr:hypothetical protein [uncultured Sphingobacterium sp.]